MGETGAEVLPITNLEPFREAHDLASEIVFGGVTSPTEEAYAETHRYKPFVNFGPQADENSQRAAGLAINDLFASAVALEKAQTANEMRGETPHSNKTLALGRPGPYEIAYDYIKGLRVQEDSAEIASGVWAKFVHEANKRYSDFERTRQSHFENSKLPPEDPQWYELHYHIMGRNEQMRSAGSYMERVYHVKPATIEHSEKVKGLEKTRANPLPVSNLRTDLASAFRI